MENALFLENAEKKKKSIGLIHRAYLTYLKNKRQHTASTKTKSEVRGGGRKPWKQKGTGRARAGSSRSPLWRGGGVSFGPKPRLVSKKVNKKERRLAILSALYLKKQQFIFVNEIVFNEGDKVKTKNVLKNQGVPLKNCHLNFPSHSR
jgi:large subunit ribosomal protein L4